MKFTAQEEYGLRCILSLARSDVDGDQKSQTISEIAAGEGLSEQYVGKLFRILARAELVESVRGRKGGYRLARPAAAIHAAETLAALGGKLYDLDLCGRYRGKQRFCVHTNDCSIRSLWSGLQVLVDQVLSRTSLKDLVCSEWTMAQWMQHHLDSLSELEPLVVTMKLAMPTRNTIVDLTSFERSDLERSDLERSDLERSDLERSDLERSEHETVEDPVRRARSRPVPSPDQE